MDKRDTELRGVQQDLGEPVSRRRFLDGVVGCGAVAVLGPLAGCGGAHQPMMAMRGGPVPEVAGARSLKAVGAQHGLLTGCAVDATKLRIDGLYGRLIAEQASLVVAENAMKWEATHPGPGDYNFEQADEIVEFAEERHIRVRGHNLCWHRAIPKWVTAMQPGEAARKLLPEHIERVAGRYAGRMHSWDVVNEAIDVKDGRADGLRASPWLKLVGPEYIEMAFRAARAADPQALLTYNEYGIEGESDDAQRKRLATMLMLRRLKTRNVPLDAVGIQSHLRARPFGTREPAEYGEGLSRFIRECAAMDLQVFLTEMDVNDRALPADVAVRDEGVAAVYGGYLDRVLAETAVTALLTWGITDRYTWLNSEQGRTDGVLERPLPFDAGYRAKGAFAAMREAIGRRGVGKARG